MRKEYEWVIQPEYETVFFSNNYEISRIFDETNDNSVIFKFWNDEQNEIEFKKDKVGKLVIPCIYKDCGLFNSDGLAIVYTTNGKVKIIDTKHNTTNEYCNVHHIEGDYLFDTIIGVKDESNLWGIIDAKCDNPPVRRYLVKPQFEDVFECCGGYSSVKHNGKWGLIRYYPTSDWCSTRRLIHCSTLKSCILLVEVLY